MKRPGLVLVAALASLAGCSGAPSGPVAATVDIALVSPFSDDGALLFTVTGGPVDSLSADGYALHFSRPAPNTLQAIVTGTLNPGTVARLYLPDDRLIAQYSVSLDQAAARVSYTQRDPAAYGLTLKP